MAIAFDSSSAQQTSTGSLTYSYTVGSGLNRFLIVFAMASSDTLTAVTYNGVSMTLLKKLALSGDAAGYVEIYAFGVFAPASGANNVVITDTSGTASVLSRAVSYSGVVQSNTVDATSSAGPTGGVTSLTVTTTVVASVAWLVGWFRDDVGLITAGTGTTMRSVGATASVADSNGSVISGSRSLQVTWTGSAHAAALAVSLAVVPSQNQMFQVF